MRRRARERYARIRADAQAYAAMLEEAREQQRERRSNGQGPRIRELDRARYWRRRALGRGLTLAELVERTGVAAELLLLVLAEECRQRRIWQDPADGRYKILYGSIAAKTMRALVELAER
jgi:hypothetical protein